jgi:tetratricopeptide (TPR) repeat protein
MIANPGDRFHGADTMPRLRSTIVLTLLLSAFFGVTSARSDDTATCKTWTGEEALAACTRMITSNTLRGGDLAQVYLWRGITHARNTGDWDRAIADFNEAIRLGSRDAGAYAGRAAAYIRKGEIDRALPDLNQGLALDPKQPGVRNVFGYYYLKKGDYPRGLTEVNEAIRLSPRYLYAFSTRGEIYEAKGELANALTDFRTALSLDPDKKQRGGREANDAIRRVEGKLLAAAGADWATCQRAPSLEDGIAACTRLISAKKLGDADLAQAYVSRAIGVGRYRGDFDLAIADYDEGLRRDPKIVAAYAGRGAAYVRKGNLDLARRDLDEGLRLDPNHFGLRNALGIYHLAKGDYGAAIAEFNTSIRMSPQYLYPYRYRAEANEERGDLAAALADYKVALSLDPGKQQIGGKEAADGIARVEQKLAADKSKVAVAEPKVSEPKASAATPKVAALGHRVALVIGNSKYLYANQLPNPANDAADIAKILRRLGFDVIEGLDLDRRGMEDRIRAFGRKLEAGADLALLFYAGHGMQVGGRNYLIPVDAKLERSGDLTLDTIELGQILAQMEAEKRVNLIFLDACRDNPLARSFARSLGTRSASVGSGLAQVQSAIGTMIAYATQPDNVALDGDGRNSPFTTALLKYIATPKLEIGTIMKRVRADVIAATREKQVPWDHSSLVGDVILVP